MKRQRNGFQNSSLPIYRDSLTLVNKASFGWVGSGYLICCDATSEWLVSPLLSIWGSFSLRFKASEAGR